MYQRERSNIGWILLFFVVTIGGTILSMNWIINDIQQEVEMLRLERIANSNDHIYNEPIIYEETEEEIVPDIYYDQDQETLASSVDFIHNMNNNIVNGETTIIPETSVIEETTTEISETTLIEKYDSVFKWQIYNGDFGEEQLLYLSEQCERFQIPMEIMLAIICTESSFKSTAQASTCEAAGYCQIIPSTGEWVYENLLQYGEYDTKNHVKNMKTNWRLNIEIACRLMNYLHWRYDGNWETAIGYYHGGSSSVRRTYLNTVNSNMNDLFGITTKDLK